MQVRLGTIQQHTREVFLASLGCKGKRAMIVSSSTGRAESNTVLPTGRKKSSLLCSNSSSQLYVVECVLPEPLRRRGNYFCSFSFLSQTVYRAPCSVDSLYVVGVTKQFHPYIGRQQGRKGFMACFINTPPAVQRTACADSCRFTIGFDLHWRPTLICSI